MKECQFPFEGAADLCYRILYLTGTFLAAYIIYHVIFSLKEKYHIKSIVKKKQNEREEEFLRIELEYMLTPEDQKILDLSDDDLLGQLQKRQLKASEVLRAYVAKAIISTKECNCITEFIPQAEEWAKALDESTDIVGPLHGMPVSIKDNCNIEGMDSTLGLGKRLYHPSEEHATIVKVLLELGAVPFCKTNVPQTLLSFDCGNPIFGSTKNHLDLEMSPGGSSGGEASLIASGGSIIGIGSDIGGSVRIPGHFCGVNSFKPTKDRVSPQGFSASLPNVVGVVGVPGFLGRRTKTITKVFQHIVEDGKQKKYDLLNIPLGFNEKVFTSSPKMRIGYFTSLPFYPPIGDTEDVILDAVKALELQGHTLVPFEMPNSSHMFELIMDFASADGGEHLLRAWKHESVMKNLWANYMFFSMPKFVCLFLSILVEYVLPFIHSPKLALMLKSGATRTSDLWAQLGERRKMVEFIVNQWRRQKLDLLICPVFPFPALPLDAGGRQHPASVYTMIWNMFDFPCGTVPFGKESGKKVDDYDHQGDLVPRMAKKAMQYSTNMPISVQIVGLPYEEEKVLKGMQILESLAPTSSKKLL